MDWRNTVKTLLTFYEITWSDSEAVTGWDSTDSIKFPTKNCKSYGFFIKQNKEYLTIAADFDEENNNFNRFIHIPLVNIKKKRRIKIC